MTKEELFNHLKFEDGDGIEYIDELQDILGMDEELDPRFVYDILLNTDMEYLSELIENYFEELTDNIPNNNGELYELMSAQALALKGLAYSCEDEAQAIKLATELVRFQSWYAIEKNTTVVSQDIGEEKLVSVREAFTLYALEKLGGEEYRYYFDNALYYPIDDYAISLSELVN
ncbi:MAG: hypothetical protein MJ145_04035 [Clostridia bacterium]|nr:hypothetical protein [Clostridia bacterium]